MFYQITAVIIVLLIIIISLIIYAIFAPTDSKSSQPSQPSQPSQLSQPQGDNAINNKVCLSLDDYNVLLDKARHTAEKVGKDETVVRDRKVLGDPLYPPLNRSDNKTHTELANNIANRNMYIKTNDLGDTYRLVGYITNNSADKDVGNNNWKLFARQKDRHISEFYMKPTDNNNDVKVPITDDIIVGDRLRDIYNIPSQITFKSPMFNKDPYNVVEVPKADLSRSADYL
jgi:hypothetical protein